MFCAVVKFKIAITLQVETTFLVAGESWPQVSAPGQTLMASTSSTCSMRGSMRIGRDVTSIVAALYPVDVPRRVCDVFYEHL